VRREIWHPFRKSSAAPKEGGTGAPRRVLADVRGHPEEVDTEFTTDWDDLSGVEVVAGEFMIVTADESSSAVYAPISRLLEQVRERAGMDVVFISQFVNGQRVIRHVAADPRDGHAPAQADADPLEATYCQRVVERRLADGLPDALADPEAARLALTGRLNVRAHVAAPIVGADGRVFGTVCAYAHQPRVSVEEALGVVRSVARVLGRAMEQAQAR
jgi:hypothetical protein